MLNTLLKKPWLTPLATFSFVLVAGTGVAMLFEAHHYVPGMKFMHEWMGPFFVVAALLHLFRNWRPFINYFKEHLTAILISIVVCLWLWALHSPRACHLPCRKRPRSPGCPPRHLKPIEEPVYCFGDLPLIGTGRLGKHAGTCFVGAAVSASAGNGNCVRRQRRRRNGCTDSSIFESLLTAAIILAGCVSAVDTGCLTVVNIDVLGRRRCPAMHLAEVNNVPTGSKPGNGTAAVA